MLYFVHPCVGVSLSVMHVRVTKTKNDFVGEQVKQCEHGDVRIGSSSH